MKGNAEVLKVLNEMLKEELTAINQYIVHAEMQENWGYHRLSHETKKQAIGEMKHAEKLIERILFLEGIPQMAETMKLKIGKSVQQQLQNDLSLEEMAVASYNRAIETARKHSDNASAELFREILEDEEDHVDFLETQLGLIEQLGLENYLVEQMEEEK
jgi:bacterioferritin